MIAGLGPDEATTVVLKAAENARAVALFRMRELAAGREDIAPERMNSESVVRLARTRGAPPVRRPPAQSRP